MDLWKLGVALSGLTYYYQESKDPKTGRFAPKWWQTALTAGGIGTFLYITRDRPSGRAAGLTAAPRDTPSPTLRFALDNKLLRTPALDWGSGQGDDLIHMRSAGVEAFGYDPHWSPEKPADKGSFEYGQLSFVLDVIPTPEGRVNAVKELLSYLRPGAPVVVSVITESRLRFRQRELEAKGSNVKKWGDGVLFNGELFMRGYSREQISALLTEAGVSGVQSEAIVVRDKPRYIIAWGSKP